MIEITNETAIESLRKIVSDGNENKKADCVYVVDGKPECIVAQALIDLGASVDLLLVLGTKAFYGESASEIQADCRAYGVEFIDESYQIFSAAQEEQDGYQTWGEALEVAEVVYADA